MSRCEDWNQYPFTRAYATIDPDAPTYEDDICPRCGEAKMSTHYPGWCCHCGEWIYNPLPRYGIGYGTRLLIKALRELKEDQRLLEKVREGDDG
ncbi:hypothetical protein ES703_108174 [subsurface metagenome]